MSAREQITRLWARVQGQGLGAQLARGSGGWLIVTAIGTVVVFVVNVVLARTMGVSHYGTYIYSLTWITVLSHLAQMGMTTSLLRFVAAYKAKADWGLLKGVMRFMFQAVGIASLVVGGVAALVIWQLRDRIGPEQTQVLLIALFLLPAISLTALRAASLRSLKEIMRATLPDNVIRPGAIGLLVGAAYLITADTITASMAMSLNIVATAIAFTIGTVWLLKRLPTEMQGSPPERAPREWLSVSLPLFLMAGMHLVLGQTDTIMIGILRSPEAAGIYSVASRVSVFVIIGLRAVNSIAAPMIAELHAKGDHAELQRMIALAARVIGVCTILAALVVIVLGKPILSLFGAEFLVAYEPLVVLLVGASVSALTGPVGFLMTMTGHQNTAAKIIGVCVVINIVGNALLIPRYGIVGAAATTAFVTVFRNLTMFVYVLKVQGLNSTIFAPLEPKRG